MVGKRRRHSASFKAKVALAAIKGERTVNEIAGESGVHPGQVTQWRKMVLEGLPGLFENMRVKGQRDEEELRDRLYQQIGQLKYELDWLKKKLGVAD
ncbi:transposase [bacterium]|nr:transposase [bacterium]